MKLAFLFQLILSFVAICLAVRPREDRFDFPQNELETSLQRQARAEADRRADQAMRLIEQSNHLRTGFFRYSASYVPLHDEARFQSILANPHYYYFPLRQGDDHTFFGLPYKVTLGDNTDSYRLHVLKIYNDGRVHPISTEIVPPEVPPGHHTTFSITLLSRQGYSRQDMARLYRELRIAPII